jgi:hypothetical protein
LISQLLTASLCLLSSSYRFSKIQHYIVSKQETREEHVKKKKKKKRGASLGIIPQLCYVGVRYRITSHIAQLSCSKGRQKMLRPQRGAGSIETGTSVDAGSQEQVLFYILDISGKNDQTVH